jgi:hypothetical protein
MSKYTLQQVSAERMISEKGTPITLARVTQGAFDPATGGTVETTELFNGSAVFTRFDRREIDGTNILVSDDKLLYVGDEPKINDLIGDKRVINVMPLNPDNSTAILYTLQVRG